MQKQLTYKFQDLLPDNGIEEGCLYISIEHCISKHRCCCGCGVIIDIPFSPDEWELIFDGESVSLYPSIGNWSYDCQSHYWIRNNKVIWARKWSQREIEESRKVDKSKNYLSDEEFMSFVDAHGSSMHTSDKSMDSVVVNECKSTATSLTNDLFKKIKSLFRRR